MRSILMLHSSSDLYGASKVFLEVIKTLKNDGYKVFVVLSEPGPICKSIHELGIPISFIRLGILRRKYLNPFGIIQRIFVMSKAFLDLRKFAKIHSIQIVYSNTIGILIGGLVAKSLGLNHIIHIHEIINRPRWIVSIFGYVAKRFSDKAIVVSDAVKECWNPFLGHKSIRVYNGFDYSQYEKADQCNRSDLGFHQNDFLIGMIGRVNLWKGQAYFLEIAARIYPEFPNAKFVMVGDAYPGFEFLYKELNDLKRSLNLENMVSALGYREDIPELLNCFDCFIQPSTSPDPFPTTVLEAMASGKPVIATSLGGVLEMIVDGQSGILIPPDNATEAFAKIKPLLSQDLRRKELGSNAKQRVNELFSKKSFEKSILHVLTNC